MKSVIEVADIFRIYGGAYREAHGDEMPLRHHRVMNAIEICRTSALGGHVEECDHCNASRISYNSCRNRHCPKCQSLDKERWLEARKRELLPAQYFHVVFTLPDRVRPIALRNQRRIYAMLFRALSESLKELASDDRYLGAQIGFTGLLHTWTQTLLDHPHIHCIVPGGGLSANGTRWISCREDFFIPVKVLSRVFRGKFLYHLKMSYKSEALTFTGKIESFQDKAAFDELLSGLYEQEWVVYCKPPFKNAETVMDYLGRYTHRVAITNDRIVKVEDDQVTFKYRDRNEGDKIKYLSLDAFEFIRRFLLHVLPDGFMKIRHYGILSNRNKRDKLLLCQELFGALDKDGECGDEKESWEDLLFRMTGIDPRICPYCGKGKMVRKQTLQPKRSRCPPWL